MSVSKKPKEKPKRKICKSCEKPNDITGDNCSACQFPLSVDDIQEIPHIFLDLVNGINPKGTVICMRSESFLILNDDYPISKNHILVIPTTEIEDITNLTTKDIPMIEEMFKIGIAEFQSRNLMDYGTALENVVLSGFNTPGSIEWLHLHLVLPPFFHEAISTHPRWHSYQKVLSDLKTHGRVITYHEQPQEKEGRDYKEGYIKIHRKYVNLGTNL